jgi:hypothetical protein
MNTTWGMTRSGPVKHRYTGDGTCLAGLPDDQLKRVLILAAMSCAPARRSLIDLSGAAMQNDLVADTALAMLAADRRGQ